MAAPDNTKFQVNYKLADGTLVNLYATDIKDLETGLTDLSMVAALITSTADQFHGSRPAASVPNNQFAPAPAAPIAQAAPAGNVCKHGPMTYKEGVNAQGKAWKGYMCNAPRGAADKCQTIWVR
jgi:hypothetical protein